MSPTFAQAVAIPLAAVASWLFGAAWYGLLGPAWLVALGTTKAELTGGRDRPSPLPFVLSFAAELVMASVLAILVAQLGLTGAAGGMAAGILAFVGFVATTVGVNHAYSGADPSLTLIDGGHWLAAMIVQGAVIGALW